MTYTHAVARDQRTIAGAWCLILTVVFFIGQFIAQATVTKPYSMITNYISDLGASTCEPFSFGQFHVDVCVPLHAAMNTGFVLSGVFLIAGVVLTWRARPRGRIFTWAWAMLAIGGAGKIVAGLCPEDTQPVAHVLGGGGIMGWIVGFLLVGIGYRTAAPRIATWSIVVAVVTFAGTVLMNAWPAGVGLAERITAWPLALWTITAGVLILRTGRVPQR